METILIVDDQEAVRCVVKTMLERCGFAAMEVASGVEALRVFELHREEISCVLLDITMPARISVHNTGGLSGEATFLALRRFRADLPILFMSGVEKEDLPDFLQGRDSVGFVHKPCCFQEFRRSLKCVLGPSLEAAVGG